MKELNGVWWTINQKQVPGTLTITDENKITLITHERLHDTSIINGFAGSEKITLVDAELDRTDAYYKSEEKEEYHGRTIEISEEVKYYTYTYISQLVIFGNDYKRKGDIRVKSLQLQYTNLEKWVNWKTETPAIKKTKENIIVKLKNVPENIAKLEKFDIVVRKPYFIIEKEYNMQIHNETMICVENIGNTYIYSLRETIRCIQCFLILCMGDNINVTKIQAIDFYGRNIEIILGSGKSNYENRSILKNIIKYDDIKDNLETILKNWLELYIDNELLVTNFVNLQTREDPLINEYNSLTTAIDNLYLVITKQKSTNDHFAEMIKRILRETNFILNLSEEEITKIAVKAKNIRRYFVHSNKTQRDIIGNITLIRNIMTFLIEAIRVRIMLEIGIDKEPIEQYYKKVDELKSLKIAIILELNDDEVDDNKKIKEGKKIMRPLSKKDKKDIAHLNAIMGTKYREAGYDLENSQDLIEAIQNITAEYMDYMQYAGKLSSVLEDFDQSLEVFYPEKWFKTVKDGTTGSKFIDELYSNLGDASHKMYKLAFEAEERCKEVWEYLFESDKDDVKQHFLGDVSNYTQEQLLDTLEEVMENIYDVDYANQIETDATSFASKIKKYLEEG